MSCDLNERILLVDLVGELRLFRSTSQSPAKVEHSLGVVGFAEGRCLEKVPRSEEQSKGVEQSDALQGE